jgi:hypothetical protein
MHQVAEGARGWGSGDEMMCVMRGIYEDIAGASLELELSRNISVRGFIGP